VLHGTCIPVELLRALGSLSVGHKNRWAIWEAAGLDDLLDGGETRTGFLLRFTNAHPGMNTNIVGTLNVDHLKENIAAASLPLQADTYAEAKRRLDGVATG
jgi:aryl-alcohol dehydrogenase-like predicted oxidoreductase